MRNIDLDTWPRRSHFEFFRSQKNPHFSLTASVDVTRLMDIAKPRGVSIFNAALFAIMDAANAVPELRTRFRGDRVTEYDLVNASVTVPIDDGKFAFCDIRFSPHWPEFDARCRTALEAARRQTVLTDKVAGEEDWIFLSCAPWVSFTSITNPNDGPGDCIPRITWGKIEQRKGAWRMPVGFEAHHALVDGLHAGVFYRELQQRLTRDFA